ncbi:translesion DNA synthesis-associated protein ImuA [Comamonas sp.]|uniref:translesion DNA synthesis-associated protein ImuA n=1 Tax=Comamonas sp. TaxID=34028 RepID=UPI00289B95CC|nr:translesion DNA synthesis-associated protein ImuA [Comamonas sp.]
MPKLDALSLPPAVNAQLWRGDHMVRAPMAGIPTGWDALDAELPGKGWPSQCLTEVLQPQAGTLEWRLTGRGLQQCPAHKPVIALGPPLPPHASGLAQSGLAPGQLVWIHSSRPQDQLWALEQLLKANAAAALLAWLPQVQPEQIRRLQISAQQFEGPVFVFRPESSQHQASAAPLRLLVRSSQPWSLQLQLLKRRGPVHQGTLELPAVPPSLQAVLPVRLWPGTVPLPQPATAAVSVSSSNTALSSPYHDTDLGRPAAPLPLPRSQRARQSSLLH